MGSRSISREDDSGVLRDVSNSLLVSQGRLRVSGGLRCIVGDLRRIQGTLRSTQKGYWEILLYFRQFQDVLGGSGSVMGFWGVPGSLRGL